MNNRHIFALCIAWLILLELRWWRSFAPSVIMTQTVTVRTCCGHKAGACGIPASPPVPPEEVGEARFPGCH